MLKANYHFLSPLFCSHYSVYIGIELFHCMHIPQPYFNIVVFQVDSYLSLVLTFSSTVTAVVLSELHLDSLFQLGSALCDTF